MHKDLLLIPTPPPNPSKQNPPGKQETSHHIQSSWFKCTMCQPLSNITTQPRGALLPIWWGFLYRCAYFPSDLRHESNSLTPITQVTQIQGHRTFLVSRRLISRFSAWRSASFLASVHRNKGYYFKMTICTPNILVI